MQIERQVPGHAKNNSLILTLVNVLSVSLVTAETPASKMSEFMRPREDMIEVLTEQGYQYITTKDEMAALRSGKVWGMFASGAMAYDIERAQTADAEPSLAKMTAKAIELLAQNDQGFFLMGEGSKVDRAAHANDPIGIISDILGFDEASRVALKFAKENGSTLMPGMSGHNNGGVSLGSRKTDASCSKNTVSRFIAP